MSWCYRTHDSIKLLAVCEYKTSNENIYHTTECVYPAPCWKIMIIIIIIILKNNNQQLQRRLPPGNIISCFCSTQRLSTVDSKAFTVAGPRNGTPCQRRRHQHFSTSLTNFGRRLKTWHTPTSSSDLSSLWPSANCLTLK